MDAYLEEELYDLLTYCAQNPDASDFNSKKQRVEDIGKELYADGGSDAMENMFYSIEFRIKEEIKKDAHSFLHILKIILLSDGLLQIVFFLLISIRLPTFALDLPLSINTLPRH